ncbi:MAG: Ldh family oxidoreductase [Pseudohaliea sp.]
MPDTTLDLAAIGALAEEVLAANGCNAANAAAVARTVTAAERDGARSHGLFRIPGYVAALRNGRVRGDADPTVREVTPAFLRVDGAGGFAPLALERGLPALAAAAKKLGVAAMTINDCYHFAALWPETEALAGKALAGIACVNYAAVVAPHGGSEAIFGTNPLAFAWPRPGAEPVVADMATAAMAQGELQLAAGAGHQVPEGTGVDAAGQPTADPAAILAGTQLPFGGHKGSAIALLVELLAAAATGDAFSYEVAGDSADGGPTRGGEFLLAVDPAVLAGADAGERTEAFFRRFEAIPGARLPGARRHGLRRAPGPRAVDSALLARIRALAGPSGH